MELSREQLDIIKYKKKFLNVVAGAGTGKTTVLKERLKYLIKELNINEKNILVLTFNKKNVLELQSFFYDDLKIMTFHGLSTSILKKYTGLLKNEYNSDFQIMDDLQTETTIKTILKFDKVLYKFYSNFNNIKYSISKIKKNIINEDILKNNKLFNYFYNKYCQYLKEHNLMDFDDLNKYACEILEDDYILKEYQDKYQYILIDEIQDIDFYQYRLIKLLTTQSLFIFGDLNQSIYGFRGANNIYIDLLIEDFRMQTFYLKTNYRSSNEIIKLANNLINYNYELKDKDKYKLITSKKSFFNNEVMYRQFENVFFENIFLVVKIRELIKKYNYKYEDIVILYRKNYLLEPLKRCFLLNKIPFKTNENQKKVFIDKKNMKNLQNF